MHAPFTLQHFTHDDLKLTYDVLPALVIAEFLSTQESFGSREILPALEGRGVGADTEDQFDVAVAGKRESECGIWRFPSWQHSYNCCIPMIRRPRRVEGGVEHVFETDELDAVGVEAELCCFLHDF